MSLAEVAERRRQRTHAVSSETSLPATVSLHYSNLPP